MRIAFGLDIAGYSTGKSGFTVACRKDSLIEITVFQHHIFATKLNGHKSILEQVAAERDLLTTCCERGIIMIDAPLELQGLPSPKNAAFLWQLTQRPVDYAFGGLPPLASLIGAPVARLLNTLSTLPEEWIGNCIFETYPAMSLQLLGQSSKGYKDIKGKINFDAGQWQGTQMAILAANLGFVADEALNLNDDEFDAVICAITGIGAEECQLRGMALDQEITRRIQAKLAPESHQQYTAPASYVLLKKLPPERIYIRKVKLANYQAMLNFIRDL